MNVWTWMIERKQPTDEDKRGADEKNFLSEAKNIITRYF